MIKTKYICDKCGLEEECERYVTPVGWNTIKLEVNKYNSNFDRNLCPKCSKELGIARDNRKSEETHNKSIGDRLVDILTEIAQGGQQ